jgi:CheY-like chemotaxis protein
VLESIRIKGEFQVLNVCIIDDHEPTALTLAEMFIVLGHEANYVSNAYEALRAVQQEKFEPEVDYYIVDLFLNGISGIDIYTELEKKGLGHKVLFISGSKPKEDIFAQALTCNVPLIMKRFSAIELVNNLNNGTIVQWADEMLIGRGISRPKAE